MHKTNEYARYAALSFLVCQLAPAFSAPSSTPLFLTAGATPNVLINLSVEGPMGGAAYNDQLGSPSGCAGRISYAGDSNYGNCYFPATTYLGYFDPNKCYTYDTGVTYTWNGGNRNGAFIPAGAVNNTSHECTSKWSGNFLNWATMTAIDTFIYTMTGGNRVIDTTTTTVIARARKGSDAWFPYKIIGTGLTNAVTPSTVTTKADSTLIIYNKDGISFGISSTRSGASGATTNGWDYFNVAVKVCSSAADKEGNCTVYTDNSSPAKTYYKPEGLIQTNAEKLRFGLTSYLLDSDQERDGGVLRSNMKYVGPRKYDGSTGNWLDNFVTTPATGTSQREWLPAGGANAGTLISNPDNASGNLNSGVINYINRFSEPGYKGHDPISELYYESLRYFKNLGPTPSFYGKDTSNGRNLTAVSRSSTDGRTGGFWFYTSGEWVDPIQYSCQKNFIIGINDQSPWLDKRLPGTSFTTSTLNGTALVGHDWGEPPNADNSINVTTWTNKVGTNEGLNTTWTATGTWTSTGTAGSVSGTNNSVGGDATNFSTDCGSSRVVTNLGTVMATCPHPQKQDSYYIAGLAYYANTTDLRTDFSGKQTVSTFMIDTQEYSSNPLDGPKNMLWLAGKYGGFIDKNNNSKPDQASEWDVDGDGVPDNYVLATQPEKMILGLQQSFRDIENRTSSSASVAANSTRLDTGTVIYQVKFYSGDWSGQVVAYSLNSQGQLDQTIWNSDTTLAISTSTQADARKIYTWNATGLNGQEFKCDSSGLGTATIPNTTCGLNATQRSLLGSTQQERVDLLSYLRGNQTNEKTTTNPSGIFRARNRTLGDVINSDPAYVGQANYGYDVLSDANGGGTTYATFRAGNATRTNMVYVGANDGMLHAFNADTGAELFSFVPNASFGTSANPLLKSLSSLTYSHKYLVDGSPVVSDAYIGSAWTTYLVGTMGMGGRSVFALDVTNPTTFTKDNVKWEFDSSVSAELGYVLGKPVIVRMGNGRWAAIFGNGYGGSSTKAKLFIVYLDADLTNGWTLGTDYLIIDTDDTTSNGLAAPAVLVDSNYTAVAVYAGDLKGNVWKFDVSANSDSNWASALKSGSTPIPLFTAKDSSNTRQPITSAPEIGVNSKGGYMLYFGTGKYFEDGDQNNRDVQTLYGIWDKLDNSGSSSQITYTTRNGTGALYEQVISEEGTDTTTGTSWRVIADGSSTDIYSGTNPKRGWYMDLKVGTNPATGERVVTDPILRNGRIIFTTLVPSQDPCSGGGTSWVMEMNAETGSRLEYNVFDIDGNGLFNANDNRGTNTKAVTGIKSNKGIIRTPTVLSAGGTEYKIASGSKEANLVSIREKGGNAPRPRTSWRQIQ